MIKRYEQESFVTEDGLAGCQMVEAIDGRYVICDDHLEEIAKRDAIIKTLRSELGTFDIDTTPEELQRLREE